MSSNSAPLRRRLVPGGGVGVLLAALLLVGSVPAGATSSWRLDEVVVVGDAVPGPLFAFVTDVAFGAEGQLLILDERAAEVFIVDDTSGRLLRRAGGQGQGPGEFVGPDRLGASREGAFAVYDREAGYRLSRFANDGSFLRSTKLEGSVGGSIRKIGVDPLGTYLLRVPSSAQLEKGIGARFPQVVLLDADLGSARVIFDWSELGMEPMRPSDPDGPIPFHVVPRPVWAFLPDGRHAVGLSDRYEVVILDREGARIGTLRRDLEQRRPTPEQKEQILAPLTPRLRALGAEWGEFFPMITDVFPGPDGTILVQRGSEHGPVIDVFSASLEFRTEVPLPEGFRLMAARDGLLAGRITTEDYESAVKVLRLER